MRLVWILMLSAAAMAQPARSVDELVTFIKTAIAQKNSDKDVAAAVQGIRLANRLDEKTVVELQRLGAGQKTVAALKHLSEATASLPAAAPAGVKPTAETPPPPSPAELQAIVTEARENALNYGKTLPNYICTQFTKRQVDPAGTGDWRMADSIVEQLSYFEQKESYKVMMVNNSMVTNNLKHEQLGGATSSGEFGSILNAVFSPSTEAEFSWERWTRLQNRVMYVLSFRTAQPMYTISHHGSQRTIHTRTRGSVFVDRETKMVMRIKFDCDGIPADFPIQQVSLQLDYGFDSISGQQFLLPLQSEIRSREGRYATWNVASYVSYHKYGADTSISFENTDIPPDKLKEQPPAPVKKK